jgi:UDP-GlcNAc:undecaprenyl-phosphate GlcNAc-1-phosphate transferase
MMTGNGLMTILAASVCGASLGFLIFNFYPAKIFMGDSGSLFLGFSLAALAITGKGEYTTNIFFAILIPVLVLAVPIFDTTFVALLRFFNGRAISQGGRDHSSHRLVAFGLSERTTVLLFYGMSLICGMVALLGLQSNMLYPSILAILIVIVLCYFGVFLSGIVAYGQKAENLVKSSHGFTLNLFLMHKRRLGEILIDSILISCTFACAFIIRFDGLPPEYFPAIVQALPLLLPLKLGLFFYFGLYRGLWRYVGMQDLLNILKAVTLGSLVSVVLMVMVFRFEGYPRSVFVIDWMLLLLAVSGVRLLVKFIDEYLSSLAEPKGKRLLIVGAGDAGEIALRELKANSQLGYIPVGFIDDDSQKCGRSINGVPILGARQKLPEVVRNLEIQEILIAIPSADKRKLMDLIRDCRSTGAQVKVMPKTLSLMESA